MKWYGNLYTTESIGKKISKIKWKLNHNKPVLNVYVITLPANPENLLDMIPSQVLIQKSYPKDNLRIVGLAKGYDDGLNLIQQIISETYNSTGTVNVTEFLKSRERMQA